MVLDITSECTKHGIYQIPKYPVFLDLTGKRVVIIGAGKVAERKIGGLLEYGATLIVISPEATEKIAGWAQEEKITLLARPYESGDLLGAFLVVCATGVASVDEQVYEEALEEGCLINVVDVPRLCNYIVPSVVKRGPLQIAISTSGAAPTVAKGIRRRLEEEYPSQWADYLDLLGEVRELVMERVPGDESVRKPIFEAVCNAGLLERIDAGETLCAQQVYDEVVAPMVAGVASEPGAAYEPGAAQAAHAAHAACDVASDAGGDAR